MYAYVDGKIVVPKGGFTCPPACYVSVNEKAPGTLNAYGDDHDNGQKIVVSKDNKLKVTQDGMNKNEYMIIGWNTNLGGTADKPNVTYKSSDGTLSTN